MYRYINTKEMAIEMMFSIRITNLQGRSLNKGPLKPEPSSITVNNKINLVVLTLSSKDSISMQGSIYIIMVLTQKFKDKTTVAIVKVGASKSTIRQHI